MENEVKTELRPEAEQAEGNITVRKNKTADFIAKVICLLLAFFLWYYAASLDTVIYEEEFTAIPVEIVNKSGFAVLSGDGMTVDVTLSGIRSNIRNIKNSDIRAYVDISNVTEAGEKYCDIKFELPSGITLEKTSAGSITLFIDNKVSKTVSVEAKPFNYNMSSEYMLHLSDINDIVITGPEQIVNNVTRAELPVDFKGSDITSGRIYSGKIKLITAEGTELSDSERRYIRLSSDTASVKVSLRGNASVPVSVSFKHGLQDIESCSFSVSHDSLRVFGDIEVLKAFTVNCVIDEKTLKSGVPVACVIGLPSGVQNVDNVTSLTVTATFKNTSEKELTVPVFSDDGERMTDIKVKLRGETDSVGRITAESVKATVDVSDGENGGSKTVDFQFLGEFDGKVYEIYPSGSPYTVTVGK